MNNKEGTPIVLIGGGGHASVLADILLRQGRTIAALIAPEDISRRAIFSGITQLFNDDDILNFQTNEVALVNGIGITPRSKLRQKVNDYYLSRGYKFTSVISDDALVSDYASIGEGVQILPKAIIQAGAEIGQHSIINSAAVIEHDTRIGEYSHIAPGAIICGDVSIGNNAYIGAGANIIHSLKLADQIIVGAGTTITKNISDAQVIVSAKNRILDK